MLMLVFVVLTGCGKAPTPVPTPMPLQIPGLEQPVATQPVVAGAPTDAAPQEAAPVLVGDLYRPIDASECQVIHDNVAAALGVRMGITEKSLEEFAIFHVQGGACFIRTKGPGSKFDLVNTLATIEGTLAGWTPSDQFRGDSPTNVSRSYTKGNATLVVGIDWEPVPEANCPQPFASCPLTPEQKIFKIVIVAMQK